MKYPLYAMIDGNKVKINTDYRVALACLDAINDESITDVERAFAVTSLLFGAETNIINMEEALKKATYFLSCGRGESHQDEEIVMDFNEDEEYIRTSFRTDYNLNLNEIEYMHWWEYNELIHGLTDKCILSKIINIRTIDESEYRDAKTLSKIRKAKKSVELKHKNKITYNAEEKALLEKLGIHLREEV